MFRFCERCLFRFCNNQLSEQKLKFTTMKKHLLLPCLLLMLAMTTAFGQLSLIPKAGATYSTFSLSDDMLDGADKPGYKMGFVLGAAFEVAVNDRLAIQP